MKRQLIILTCIFLAAFAASEILYCSLGWEVMLSLAITFGTISYHFIMRLLVGYVLDAALKNKVDYKGRWFRLHKWEEKLFRMLGVKKWKSKMPTFEASYFDPRMHSWEEIAGAMCQAELVHEAIILLSFLPIIAGIWFGAYPVFIITSIAAALMDLCFVIMQRYNRPRVVKLVEMTRRHA